MPIVNFTELDQIPQELRVEGMKPAEDGSFSLNLVHNDKLKEFRDNNIAVAKEKDDALALVKKLQGLVGESDEDIAKFEEELNELRSTKQKVSDGELTEKTNIEDEVTKRLDERVTAMKSQYGEQIAALTKVNSELKDSLTHSELRQKRTEIDRAVNAVIIKDESGVNKTSTPDILRRAHEVFHVEDDNTLIPKNGEAIIYGADGVSPMTADEWVASLKETAPHFFVSSSGGGAEGGKEAKVLGGISKEDFAKMKPEQKLALANKVASQK